MRQAPFSRAGLERLKEPGTLRRNGGVWLVALGAALWGTNSILRVEMLHTFTSSQIVFLEHLLLAIYALPVLLLARGQLARLTAKEWGAILFLSWGGSGLATILFTASFQYGHPNLVLLLQKVQPVFVLLIARVMLKELLPRRFGGNLLIAMIGTYLVTYGFTLPWADFTDANGMAAMLALGAALLWGGSTVMGRLVLGKMSFETLTAARFLFALPFLYAVVVISGEAVPQMWNALGDLDTLGNLVLQALLPGLFSLLLYYRGLSTTKASYATVAELAFPATGLLLNWVALGSVLTAGQAIGFLVIWWAIYQLGKGNEREA